MDAEVSTLTTSVKDLPQQSKFSSENSDLLNSTEPCLNGSIHVVDAGSEGPPVLIKENIQAAKHSKEEKSQKVVSMRKEDDEDFDDDAKVSKIFADDCHDDDDDNDHNGDHGDGDDDDAGDDDMIDKNAHESPKEEVENGPDINQSSDADQSMEVDNKEDEDEEEDKDKKCSPSLANERPKRDVQRRSVFEMLRGEMNEDDEDEEDVEEVNENETKNGGDGGKKKRKNRDEDIDLDPENMNDDNENDEDFIAENQKKPSPAKRKSVKTEEKTLVLFDDDDLPLKGKRSGGRAKKKKMEDNNDEKIDEKESLEWHRTGKISGKLFEDDDDDIHDDFDDYYKQQQQIQQPKATTLTYKKSLGGASMSPPDEASKKLQSGNSSKKIKIDVQGWKFIKPRDVVEAKTKSRSSHNQSSSIQQLQHPSSSSAPHNISRQAASADRVDDELKRKQSILTTWESKLRSLDSELEERVSIIRKNEGKIAREERRLREVEAVLNYRDKLLSSCEEFSGSNSSAGNSDVDVAEKLASIKRDYEKYRRLAEEHRKWIDREHHKLDNASFFEGKDSVISLPPLEVLEDNNSNNKTQEVSIKPDDHKAAVTEHSTREPPVAPPEESTKVEV